MNQHNIILEVCVASVEKALIAERAGAHRIELNTALELDGLSPTPSLLMAVLDHVNLPVISMARPRPGDFCYSEIEWQILKDDASWMLDMGAAGIATGCLLPDGSIDVPRLGEIRDLTHGKQLVFHLASEKSPDWRSDLERLIGAGVDRVMTRGRAATASDGATTIREMIGVAGDRIEVLPAGSINSDNVRQIVDETGCSQVHGSFARKAVTAELLTEAGILNVFQEIQSVANLVA